MSSDSEMPMDNAGRVYHLACTADDIADRIIFVGDPDRVETVAANFENISFRCAHREIRIITGEYKGVRVSVLSTGMGTDNIEIVMNELHILKEYDVPSKKWATIGAAGTPPPSAPAGASRTFSPRSVKIIRVGTCGSPAAHIDVGTLAISSHGIGMDNTCRYYAHAAPPNSSVGVLQGILDASEFQKVGGAYAVRAHPDIVAALRTTAETRSAAASGSGVRIPVAVGITASGSGFYGCQGREVGRFRGQLVLPNLLETLRQIHLPSGTGPAWMAGGGDGGYGEERVINIEMENSALCCFGGMLGYRVGTICVVVAKRAGERTQFAPPETQTTALSVAILSALDVLATLKD